MENERLYNDSIILIGPSGAGKTAVADEIEIMTSLKRLRLDEVANRDRDRGFKEKFRNVEEYNAYMIKTQIEMAEKAGIPGVVDFGGGHSVYDNKEIFDFVKKQMSKFKNVVLLLPSHDLEKSLQILASRSTGDYRPNKKFITSPCNKELATMIIYENGRNPRQIAEEILRIIEKRNKNNDDREER